MRLKVEEQNKANLQLLFYCDIKKFETSSDMQKI